MGWKDILRPIRDGFRDNIPSRKPDDGDESGRRRERRERDALKGFTYLESFEELQQWAPDHVGSTQRANTPLLPRASAGGDELGNKSTLTLIHDYSGNYHEYEAAQGSFLDHEAYSCGYLQSVGSFVYFSHKLVCVPPPSWTNTLHRNGVKSLGTFLVEPQCSDMSKMLHRRFSAETQTWDYPVASQLISISRTCGFDGWLLNIEKTFPLADWDRESLVGFIRQLRSAFDDRCTIWYDSLTTNNTIRYQNGLTQQNIAFAQAAGAILTNYAWDPQKALDSKSLALQRGMDPQAVIFGIDVWAQNTGSQKQGRTTYPEDEGGGTGTGMGVAKLAEIGLGAGIFAPAWAYEHFTASFQAVERSMWAGDPLPDTLQCGCTPAHRHAIQQYQSHPILRHARDFTAGSEKFFYADFVRPFKKNANVHPVGKELEVHVGSQSILPCMRTSETALGKTVNGECTIFGRIEDSPPRAVIFMQPGPTPSANGSLKLFKVWMGGALNVSINYRKPETPPGLQIWLEIGGVSVTMPVPSQAIPVDTLEQDLDCREGGAHITAISVAVEGRLTASLGDSTVRLIELLEVCIRPSNRKRNTYKIQNVVLDSRDDRSSRLSWDFCCREADETGSEGMPHSQSTGPFSFFVIEMDGKEVGRAYCLEYLLEKGEHDEAGVRITGVGFDGELICTFEGTAQQVRRKGSGDSWDVV